MGRILKGLGWAVAGIVVVVGLVFALADRDSLLAVLFGPVEIQDIDFETLEPTDRPNRYLVCPPNLCAAEADRESPVFEIPAPALRARWMRMIAAQPRTSAGAADDAALQYDFVQRSRLISYPDTVTVRFIALDGNRSTLALYSRSNYGYDDFGVNQARIEDWLAQLQALAD